MVNSEIEFSVMRSSSAGIELLLKQFEAEHGIHVRLRLLDWDTAWSDLIKVALYSDGPDISEIGTTWLGDVVAMNAVSPIGESDLQLSGFLAPAWESTHLAGEPQMWAIPWVAGARMLFFRRALLEQARVDETTGFLEAARLDETLGALAQAGIRVPWTIPTGLTHTTLHNVASWVWGAGGDFVTPDGRRTLFHQPEALAGLHAYFRLGRYLASAVRHLTGLEPDRQFIADAETGITMSGPWLFLQAGAEMSEQLGVGLPPGPSFVGGSHLVIWKHTPHFEPSLELARFLTRPDIQVQHSQNVGLLPTRLEALASPPFSTHPLWQLATRALKSGRSFPVTRSWGLMEDRLTIAFSRIWAELLETANLDLDRVITRRLDPLAKRLDLVLGQS